MNTNQIISDEAFDKWLSGEMPPDKKAKTPSTPVAVEQEAAPVEKQEVVVDDAKFDKWLSGDLEEEYGQPLDEQYAQNKRKMENEIKRRLDEIPFSIGFGNFTYTADDTKWSDIIGTDAVSALVGFGYGMVDTVRGIKQMLNMDVEEEKQNEAAMRTLLSSDEYGTEAFAGMIGGAITDPAGIAMGGPLGMAATKIKKLENLSNIAKYSLAGGVVGGVQTGTGYIDDESGITRPMMIGLGVVGGGAAGFIGGKLVDRAAAKELNQQLESIRFFEGEVARKVESGLTLNEAVVKIADDFPLLKAEVDSAIKATGVQPDFVSAIRNAPIEKEASRGMKPLDGISRGIKDFGNGVDKVLGIISTRVKNIDARTAGKLRWYDAAVSSRPEKYGKMREDFAAFFPTASGRKGVKTDWVFNDQEIIGMNRMLNKGDFEGVRSFLKLRRGDEAVKAFNKALKINEELGQELVKYGILKKEELVDNYWHIAIPKENREEFMELMKVSQPDISKSWEERLAKLNESSLRKNGHVLTEFQEGLAFQKFILGGADSDEIAVHGFLKKRKKFNWSPEMLRLQASPIESMDSYIHGAVQEIEKAKFFGPDVYASGYKGNADGVFDLGKVLDHYEANFMKGLDPDKQKELKEILRLRFGNAMVGASAATQTYKAMVNISLLANFVSAITQLGDIGVAMYKNGVKNTLSSALEVVQARSRQGVKALGGLDAGPQKRITIEDLGLEQRFQEWEDVSKNGLNRMQDFFFRWSGFSEVDRLGKEAFVNSSAKKMVDIVNNPSGKAYKDWVKKNQKFLGGDMSNVLDAFKRYAKSGNKEDLGDDGLAYLFSELANIQPISRSEVPEFYLRGDAGKLLFTLKTFMLKQLDIIRNDGWNMVKQGKQNGDTKMMREGAANLVRYLGIVGSTNIAATHLKDLVSGREDLDSILPEEVGAHLAVSAFTELMLANMKTFGFDPYTMEKLTSEGGLAQAAGEIVLPPFLPAANEAWKLMMEGELTPAEKKRLLGYFPVIGRVVNQRIYQESGSMFDPEKEQGSLFAPEQDQPSMFKDESVQNFAEGGIVKDSPEDNPVLNNPPPLSQAATATEPVASPIMPSQTASQPLQEENVSAPTSDQPEESVEAMQARMTAPEEGKQGMTHEPPVEGGEASKAVLDTFSGITKAAGDIWTNLDLVDKLALSTAPIPVLGDLLGLSADVKTYIEDPESNSWSNYGLTALGVLPFIPNMSLGIKVIRNGKSQDVESLISQGISPFEGKEVEVWRGVEAGTIDRARTNPREVGEHATTNPGLAESFVAEYSDKGKTGGLYHRKVKLEKGLVINDAKHGNNSAFNVAEELLTHKDFRDKESQEFLIGFREDYKKKREQILDVVDKQALDEAEETKMLADYIENLDTTYSKKLRDALVEKGYDHVAYVNKHELINNRKDNDVSLILLKGEEWTEVGKTVGEDVVDFLDINKLRSLKTGQVYQDSNGIMFEIDKKGRIVPINLELE